MKLEYLISTILPIVIFILFHPKWRRTVKCYAKYLFFFLYLAVISVLGFPLCLRNPGHCKSMWVYASMITPVSKFLGIKWEIRHPEKLIGDDKSAVCIANHQTMYDIVGMLLLWRSCSLRCAIVARSFFFWVWPVGLAMWAGGIIFIKRQPGSDKTKTFFNEATDKLFKKNEKLWVYVEGTRNNNPEKLLPFKKGAFITAIKHQVPLQPIIYSPFYFLDLKNKRFDSGKVIIEVMDPIPTAGLTHDDLDELIAKTYGLMSAKNDELRNEMKEFIRTDEKSQ